MDESDLDSLNADERPPVRPNLEAMTVEEVFRRLDDVASGEGSSRLFELRVHETLGLPLIGERGIRDGCPLDVALDAVHYRLTFDSSRVPPACVRLTPRSGQVVVWSGGLEGRLVGLSGQVVFVL
jgi:hypothetical protein